jgi:hypothetical protein
MDSSMTGLAGGLFILYVILVILGFIVWAMIMRWAFKINALLQELKTISAHSVYQGQMLEYISRQLEGKNGIAVPEEKESSDS